MSLSGRKRFKQRVCEMFKVCKRENLKLDASFDGRGDAEVTEFVPRRVLNLARGGISDLLSSEQPNKLQRWRNKDEWLAAQWRPLTGS